MWLKALIGVTAAAAGFAAAERFERRPAGQFAVLGVSLGAQLAAAQADLTRCRADRIVLRSAMQAQSASIEAAAKAGALATERAAVQLRAAQAGQADAEAAAARLLHRPPAGIDACSRMESADAAVLESLR